MQVAPPFFQILVNIYPRTICVKCLRILFSSSDKDLKCPVTKNLILAFLLFSKFCQIVCRYNFNMILTNCDGLESGNILTQYEAPPIGRYREEDESML